MSASCPQQKFHSSSRFPLLFLSSLGSFSILFLRAKLGDCVALWFALTPPQLKWLTEQKNRAVIKSRGPGISPGYNECGPRLLLLENRRKIEPKEIPCCLISLLLVVFTRQLEILVTTLNPFKVCKHTARYNKFSYKYVKGISLVHEKIYIWPELYQHLIHSQGQWGDKKQLKPQ